MIVLFALVLAALSASGNVVVTKAGETATLECGVKDSENLVWRRGTEAIVSVYARMPFNSRGTSKLAMKSHLKRANLEIRGVDKADAGKFNCQAGGHHRDIALFVISVSAEPQVPQQGKEATLRCEVNGPNPVTQVQWTKPDGSAHTEGPGSGSAHLKSVSSSDKGTWKCSFSFGGETYNQDLYVTVEVPTPTTTPPAVSRGKTGGNNQSGNEGGTVQPNHWSPMLLGLSWYLWVAIGVGCLFVVVLLILVICFFRRNRRKKRKIQQMKNGLHLRAPVQYCQCNCPTAAAKPQQRRQREKPSAPRYEHPSGGVTQKAAYERGREGRENVIKKKEKEEGQKRREGSMDIKSRLL